MNGDPVTCSAASDDCCQYSSKARQKDGAGRLRPIHNNNNTLELGDDVTSAPRQGEVTSSQRHRDATSALRRRDVTSSSRPQDSTSAPQFPATEAGGPPPSAAYKHPTLTHDEVCVIFREPFIQTGYRLPYQPWCYYLRSLFWLHNETMNVWTHAFGCVCLVTKVLMVSSQLDAVGDPRAYTVIGFALGMLLSSFLSSMAHLFHSKSPRLHCVFFLLDYAGISFYNFSNAIGAMYLCSHPYTFAQMESFFLPVSFLLTWLNFVVISLVMLRFKGGHMESERKVMMASTCAVTFGFFGWPMSGRYWECLVGADSSLSSMNHITVSILSSILSAVFYAAHFPERRWPGGFDVWGHGHQWFHMITIVTQQLQLRAVNIDLVELEVGGHAVPGLPSLPHILLAFLGLALLEGLTLWLLVPLIDRRVASQAADHHAATTGQMAEGEDGHARDKTKTGDARGHSRTTRWDGRGRDKKIKMMR